MTANARANSNHETRARSPGAAEAVHDRNLSLLAVYLLFTLSGATALIYQVVWSRMLHEIFGVTIYAVTTVLAAFLGGLALGSVIIGRAVDRSANPLRFYGLLEIGIGLTALAGPWLLTLLEPAHHWAANRFAMDSPALLAIRVLLAAVVILPPTFLMGGTLPVITRYFVQQIARLGQELSVLYGLNTLGAVAGSLASGFWLIRWLGLHATLHVSVVGNVALGLLAILLARRFRLTDRSSEREPPTRAGSAVTSLTYVGLLLMMCLSGIASFGYEVVWTRMLVLIVGTTTYAFVTMLTSFLVGITLGSLVTRLLIGRIRDQRQAFGWIQIGIAATALLTLPLMAYLSTGAAQNWLAQTTGNWLALIAARFGFSFLIMLLPATLIGMTFPLAGALAARELRSLGGRLGAVYGANTLGNIIGATATGFALVPLFGLQKCLVGLTLLNLIAAAWGLLTIPVTRCAGAFVRATPIVGGLIACGLLLTSWRPGLLGQGDQQPGDRVLYYKEGLVATVKVIQKAHDAAQRVMSVDGIVIGQSGGGVDQKQQALAHFPFLLLSDPPPRRVLSIGLGTGILIGEVARHPTVTTVDCLEISPSVIEAAHLYDDLTDNVLRDPRVRIITDDGVNYLKRTAESYDAVISDGKSRTGHGGNATFYSADYYHACRARLNADGLMIQWIPLDVPPAELRIIVRTFLNIFPHTYAWVEPPFSCYLVGRDAPLRVNVEHMDTELSSPHAAHLNRWGWQRAGDFLGFLTADTDMLSRLAGDVPINSFAYPIIEFYSFADFAEPSFSRVTRNLEAFLSVRQLPQLSLNDENQSAVEENHRAATLFLEGLLSTRRPDALVQGAGLNRIEAAIATSPQNGAIRHAAAHVHYLLSSTPARELRVRHLQRAMELWPEHVGAHLAWGTMLLKQGQVAEALPSLRAAHRINPQLRDVQRRLGAALAQLGQFEEAATHFRRAQQIHPNVANDHVALGQALAALGRFAEAAAEYRRALAIDPRNERAQASLVNAEKILSPRDMP